MTVTHSSHVHAMVAPGTRTFMGTFSWFPRQKYSSSFNVKKLKIKFRNIITRVRSIESNSEILFPGCILFWNFDSRVMV